VNGINVHFPLSTFFIAKLLMTTKDNAKAKTGELLFGAHAIIEMLKAKRRKLIGLYTTKPLPKAWERIERFLPKFVPNIQYVSRDILDRMAGTADHNGVVAWVSPFKYATQLPDPAKKPFILLLDSIQDVRNVGAILRSAHCIGIDAVVMCKTSAAPMNATVFKASAGLAEYMEVFIAPSMKHAAQELSKAGYNMYMAVLDGQDATKAAYKKPACLVIGNEAVGITAEVKKMGTAITLPQRTADMSFNASVAAGILMFMINEKIK
jgi:23S rRNA (guanosine2251-2'-O)-methyltransferase